MLIIRYLESKPNKNKITVYQQKKMWCKLIYQKIEHEQKYVVKKSDTKKQYEKEK